MGVVTSMAALSFLVLCHAESALQFSPRDIKQDQRLFKRQADKPSVTCPKPSPPANGIAEFENAVSKPGDAVKYICNEHYTMIGGSTRHCEDSGRWRGERPTCEKLCSFPTLRETNGLNHQINPGKSNDLLTTAGNIVIREIQFECNKDFIMSGSARIRCIGGGIWDADPPICVRNGTNVCADPGLVENGDRILPVANSHLPGTVINFTCKDKHRMKGTSVVVCTDGGTWTSQLPQCISTAGAARCSTPKPPNNGDLEISVELTAVHEEQNTHPPNTTVRFKCREWYELDGPATIRCLPNGQWSGSSSTVCKPVCGKIPDDKIPFIVNGTSAKDGSWPWQVAFTQFDASKDVSFARFIHCGGAVLNEMWTMTAAHCVTQKNSKIILEPASLLLFFGKHYHEFGIDDNSVERRRVQFINVHNDYDPLTFDNDIALVMLTEPLKIGDRIRPICLPRADSQRTYQPETTGLVMGWGYTEENRQSEDLKYVILPLVSQETCQKSYKTILVTENMFCAGFKEGGQSTCEGDSGGPMGFLEEKGNDKRFYAEGVVSWGNSQERGCANAARYGGFVRVANFVDWIHSVITTSEKS